MIDRPGGAHSGLAMAAARQAMVIAKSRGRWSVGLAFGESERLLRSDSAAWPARFHDSEGVRAGDGLGVDDNRAGGVGFGGLG